MIKDLSFMKWHLATILKFRKAVKRKEGNADGMNE